MKLNIRGDKIEVTDSIKTYVDEKLSKLDKYFKEELEAKVLIRVRNNLQFIEVTIPTNKFTIRAEAGNSDLYAAIDKAEEVLERQIRKNNTRIRDRYKKETISEFNFELNIEADVEEPNKIIKRKTIEIKPMDEEEAILQMELLNHDFFMFKNVDEECISVIYKRKDGEYGIINSK